jgi:recombination associated protein RdgC
MADDRAQLVAEKAFLGTEFLTWIWFHSSTDEGRFEVPELEGDAPLFVWVEDRLALDNLAADGGQADAFRGGEPANSPEAHTALRMGKKASEARLRVEWGDREWLLTLKSRSLDLASIKLPPQMQTVEDDRFYERMELLEDIDVVMTQLYQKFLDVRLGDHWGDELDSIREWVARPIEL